LARVVYVAVLFFLALTTAAKPFGIHVIDDATARGVPLVELKTTSQLRLYTDSAGWIAIDDPALLNHRVYFAVSSHGYEFPADGFGSHGIALDLTDGGEKEIRIHRLNIAERLYRVTGEGIYRDSLLLGKPVPIAEPLINAKVTGQDSVQCAIYRDKLWWFFGDTANQAYALGNFSMSGATSALPDKIDPERGLDLHYFTDKSGFSRPMIAPTPPDPNWLGGVLVVNDAAGRPRMLGTVTRVKSVGKALARYIAIFNDETGTFEKLRDVDLSSRLYLCGHPFRHTDAGAEYFYFGDVCPNLRVRATFKDVCDPSTYEAYDHRAWKRGGTPDDVSKNLRDAETKKPIRAQSGSVSWNDYRHKWLLIAVQLGGSSSMLGEVWYAEADAPEGPWRDAVKIVTHDRYSFYNPVQHPFFARDRYIYFQGTYSATFSRSEAESTPRYDYNQIMYRLDLSDDRLHAALKSPPQHP
jgi:hypothetical protein